MSYIDIAKVLGIFLIVLGHIPMTNKSLMSWVFLFYVPLFFFISGFLHKQMSNILCLKKAMYMLIIPYIIYSLIGTFLFPAFQNYFFYKDQFTVQIVLIEPAIKFITGTIHGPIWFLLALFWMRIGYNWLMCNFSNSFGIFQIRVGILIISLLVSFAFNRCACDFNYYQLGTFILAFIQTII